MNKKLASGVLALSLLGGGAAAVEWAGLAGAAQDGSTTTVAPSTTGTDAQAPAADANRPDPGERIKSVLKPLVDNGTINQSQADAVQTALEAAKPDGGPGGRGGHGPGPGLAVAAKALGMDEAALKTELQANKSVADVASEKGVDINTVITSMVDDLKTHLSQEVTDGTHTQAEADAKLSEATTRITEAVNTKGLPHGGPGGRGGRHGGPGADAGTAPADAGSTGATGQ